MFGIRKDGFYIDGKPFRMYSGAMHYFRILPEYWDDRFAKMKAAGFNTVETVMCWNMHEPREGKFISDIVLQVLSFVAENERESIKARQAEGIKIAHQKGVRFGRPSFVYLEEFLSVANDYLCKRIKLKTALQLLNINQSNFFYHIYKIKKNKSILQ